MFFDKLISTYLKTQTISFLFLGWLITLPFGAKIASVSVGLFTIYPNLIFTLFLLPYFFFSFKKWNKFAKFLFGFLLIWLITAIFVSITKGLNSEALFDIRSLFFQLFFYSVILNTFSLLGTLKFKENIVTGLRFFFGILLFFGLVEFFTGIHFAGFTTAKFEVMPISNVFYAPLFIYDNPNDYLCYGLIVLLFLVIFDSKLREKKFLIDLFLVIFFFFAQYADSKFGMWTSFILLAFHGIWMLLEKAKTINWYKIAPYFIGLMLLVVLVISNPLFIGPKYKNGANYRLNDLKLLTEKEGNFKIQSAKETLTPEDQNKLIQYLDSANTKSPEGSSSIRKNLIFNGIDFIKEAPFSGIGPGAYRTRHITGKVNYPVHTLTSAHNFPIELISQYGLFGWIYFGIIGWFFIQSLKAWKSLKEEKNLWLIALFCILPILWMMPSSYLYLDINWLFLPFVFCVISMNQSKTQVDEIRE